MSKKQTPLHVWYRERLVGRLIENSDGRLEFTYEDSWSGSSSAFPISVSLPLDGTFQVESADAFFVNLLPEASVRQRICAALKISPGNDFQLLKDIGGDCAGALAITESETPPAAEQDYRPISDEQLAAWSAGTPDAFSAVTGQNEVRLSLAGAQDKLPVHLIGKQFYIPHGNSPSTHIIKFASPFYSHLPENETFVCLLATHLNLPAVEVQPNRTARKAIAVIGRYDRYLAGKEYLRLHQEDFCQALGIDPRRKYEKEGGPGLVQCATIIRKNCSLPIVELKKLLDWTLFNLYVGNSDAHGKNLSLLYHADGQRSLAPFYDLVCTRNYPRIDRHTAMKIGDRTDPGLIGADQLKGLANDLNIGWKLVQDRANELGTKLVEELPTTSEMFEESFGPSPVLARIATIARKQVKRVLRELKQ